MMQNVSGLLIGSVALWFRLTVHFNPNISDSIRVSPNRTLVEFEEKFGLQLGFELGLGL